MNNSQTQLDGLLRNYRVTLLMFLITGAISVAAEQDESSFWADLPVEIHGFAEARSGYRLQNDLYQKDMSIMEARLQTEVTYLPDWGEVLLKGDAYGDAVLERGGFDWREASLSASPLDFLDLKVGRQVMTWGTGDLVFINDLFPKDWQSFFIGRDMAYLKAPSDAVKASLFFDPFNLDIVYSPKFDADRYIRGERLSYWNNTLGRTAGQDAIVSVNRPDDYFEDDELALRAYKTIKGYQFAAYGYWGFWKSPAGSNATFTRAQFPALNVYGASVEGQWAGGIANVEVGYYDSHDDRSGNNALINNSEMRYLAGYSRQLPNDLGVGLQYYIEQLLDYGDYKANLPGGPARDRYRHLLTLRLTKLLMNQNLTASLFTYYSPSDQDTYLRPHLHYKANDRTALELGANVFMGDTPHTFFGQFEDNTNVYGGVRYSF